MANENPAPQGPTAHIEIVGPERASEILAGNKYNRKVNVRRVARYAAQMASKHWVFTGESVIINSGELLDGSHRLRGIVEANVSIPLVIVEHVDSEAFKFIDSGAGRSLSDSLYIEGRPNPRLYAAGVNYLTGFLKYNRWTTGGFETHDKWKTIEEYTELEDIIPLYTPKRGSAALVGINRGILIAAHVLFQRANPEASAEFGELLTSDEDLDPGHPVRAFHNWWQVQVVKDPIPKDLAAKTGNGLIRTWNAFRKNEQIDKLRPPTTAPEIV
jgi:hypothetical protein